MYFQPQWLDAVCVKGSWDVVVLKTPNGKPEGVLVYHHRNYKGFNLILMPPLTAYSGIWLFYPEGIKRHSRISFENRVIQELYDRLPEHALYYQQWHPRYQNWLPLYWQSYHQTTRYTYRLHLDKNNDNLWSQLKGSVRTSVRSALPLTIIKEAVFEEYWTHLEASCKERQKKNPFNKRVLERILEALQPSSSVSIRMIYHKDTMEPLGGIIVTKDEETSYYLSGFYYPDRSPRSAFSVLLWDAISQAESSWFDFEGSIIPDIEHFFRSFGGQLTPHYKIWRIPNPLLRMVFKFKKLPFLE